MNFINHCESARHHLVCLWYIPKNLIQYYSTLYSLGKKNDPNGKRFKIWLKKNLRTFGKLITTYWHTSTSVVLKYCLKVHNIFVKNYRVFRKLIPIWIIINVLKFQVSE